MKEKIARILFYISFVPYILIIIFMIHLYMDLVDRLSHYIIMQGGIYELAFGAWTPIVVSLNFFGIIILICFIYQIIYMIKKLIAKKTDK